MAEERAELEGLARSTKTEHRLRQRARIVLLAADGVASQRSDGRLDVQPARRRSGGCVTPRSGLRVSTKRASGALSRSTRPRRTSASWRCWIKRRRRVMRAGQGPCWRPRSTMSMSNMSGVSCARRRSPRRAQILVREQRSRVRRQSRRRGRALHGTAQNAIVICVDEKPSIQALERAQGYLKLPKAGH